MFLVLGRKAEQKKRQGKSPEEHWQGYLNDVGLASYKELLAIHGIGGFEDALRWPHDALRALAMREGLSGPIEQLLSTIAEWTPVDRDKLPCFALDARVLDEAALARLDDCAQTAPVCGWRNISVLLVSAGPSAAAERHTIATEALTCTPSVICVVFSKRMEGRTAGCSVRSIALVLTSTPHTPHTHTEHTHTEALTVCLTTMDPWLCQPVNTSVSGGMCLSIPAC